MQYGANDNSGSCSPIDSMNERRLHYGSGHRGELSRNGGSGSKFACRLGFLGDIRNSKRIVAGQAEARKFWFPTKKSSNST